MTDRRARRAAVVVALGVLAGCGSSPSADPDAFCGHYIAAAQAGSTLVDARAESVKDFQAKIHATDREVAAAAASAPDVIADQVDALRRALGELRDAVDDAESLADVDDAVADHLAATAALAPAADAVDRWVGANCGVANAHTSTTSAPPPSTPESSP